MKPRVSWRPTLRCWLVQRDTGTVLRNTWREALAVLGIRLREDWWK